MPNPILPHLVADAPHPDIPAAQRIFAPFIGSWELEVTWYENGKLVRTEPGEWHFSWVLEGRGIQDVWIVPSRGKTGRYEYGTSIRFYDADAGAWRSTWIGPVHKVVCTFLARRVGGEVVLETDNSDPRLRWVFSDITADAFIWRNWREEKKDWVLQQQFIAKRAAAEP
jgi:hypothetical protein